MKPKDIAVTCVYYENGEDIQEIIISSFAVFLQKELGSFEKHKCHDV